MKDSIEKERRGSIWKTAVYGRDEGSLLKALHVTRTQSLLPMDVTTKMGTSNDSITRDFDYKRAKKADNFLKHNIKHLTKYDPDHHTCARFIWYDTLPIRVGTSNQCFIQFYFSRILFFLKNQNAEFRSDVLTKIASEEKNC